MKFRPFTVIALAFSLLLSSAATGDEKKPENTAFKGRKVIVKLKDKHTQFMGVLQTETFRLKTSYGILEVPVKDIIFVQLGSLSSKRQIDQAKKWIEELNDTEQAIRDKAMASLTALGAPVIPILDREANLNLAEVKWRIKDIKEAIEKSKELKNRVGDDYIEARDLKVSGILEFETLDLKVSFANECKPAKEDIEVLEMGNGVNATYEFTGNYNVAGGLGWAGSGLKVRRGTEVTIKIDGQVTNNNWGGSYGPEGIPGNPWNNFLFGTLVLRVGSEGKQVATKNEFSFTPDSDGELFFTLNYSGGHNTGSFKISVKQNSAEDE